MISEQENSRLKKNILLRVVNLKKYFPIAEGLFSKTTGYIKAVDGISFNLKQGHTIGLVGESGCGKTTLGMSILRLIEPSAGEVFFKETNITNLKKNEVFKIYKDMQIIFQNTYGSLNPRMSVGDIIGEPLIIHKITSNRRETGNRIIELLGQVGLDSVYLDKYPHELSGGQRQRVGIARALSLSPKLIICDEPTSSLDVSIQAQIINLLKELKEKLSLSYIFISHDLSLVKHISDQIAVMYLGKIVEMAPSEEIAFRAKHPYSKALISSIPIPDPEQKQEIIPLKDEITSQVEIPAGCRFHNRCPYVKKICLNIDPELREIGKDWSVACHIV